MVDVPPDRIGIKLGATMKVLDLTLEAVRYALIHGKETPIELYQSDLPVDYDGGH